MPCLCAALSFSDGYHFAHFLDVLHIKVDLILYNGRPHTVANMSVQYHIAVMRNTFSTTTPTATVLDGCAPTSLSIRRNITDAITVASGNAIICLTPFYSCPVQVLTSQISDAPQGENMGVDKDADGKKDDDATIDPATVTPPTWKKRWDILSWSTRTLIRYQGCRPSNGY